MWWIFLINFCSFLLTGHCHFSDFFTEIKNFFGNEQCDNSPDFSKLKFELKEKLFGQDIVIDKLLPVLETHFMFEPKKALVICMHGWTGSGKNYATQIIIDGLFKKKSNSEFVRVFNGRLHFPLDIKEYVDQYKINIQNWVKGNVTNCHRSLFVFDEVDRMPAGVLDSIKPFLDYHEKIDSIDFRKSIFIFISNIGAEVINSRYMEIWKQGRSRVDMLYKDFEPYLKEALYKTKGGFKESSILEGHLVSLYLPFLPLEEEQIKMCIRAEFKRQKVDFISEDYVNLVLNEMEFNSDRFSTSGCKRIADIVTSVRYQKNSEEL